MKNNSESPKNTSEESKEGERTLFIGSKKALIGAVLAGSISFGGQWLVGQVYSAYEARQLLEAVAASSLYLGGAVVTASATVIALMLTMISLSKSSDGEFDAVFFRRVQRISFLSTVALIGGILLLLFLSIPLQESDQVPAHYFKTVYYVLIVYLSLLSGLLVGIVLMLLNAVNSLINVVKPDMDEEVDEAKQREENE
ncbi:MAG: hypothetical protein HKN25_16330 [Pyrinomonadaceae bacterium]|nr:hypothetical protein [Pyrinomonadaceae bacterium]